MLNTCKIYFYEVRKLCLNNKNEKIKIRFLINNNKIIFIDGLIGGGKSLIANITGSIKDVDWWRYESKFEQICSLNYSKN